MRLLRTLALLAAAPTLALAEIQVVGDGACPTYAADIAAFATCEGDRVARPADDAPMQIATLAGERVAARKRTDSGLHVTAAEAHRLLQAHPGQVALIDIRSRAEIAFVGQPDRVDIHVPYLEPAQPLQWGAGDSGLKMQRNPAFVDEVRAELARRDWPEDSVILLLCRSGERSAIAADALAAAGLPRVFTIVDGFEGDLGASGQRIVNGWKNAGAPWQARPLARLTVEPAH